MLVAILRRPSANPLADDCGSPTLTGRRLEVLALSVTAYVPCCAAVAGHAGCGPVQGDVVAVPARARRPECWLNGA